MLRSHNSLIVVLLLLAAGAGTSALWLSGKGLDFDATAGAVPAPAPPAATPLVLSTPGAEARPGAGRGATARYVGVIFARQSADIVARSEGRLESIAASLGDHLEPGDVVARIESDALDRQLEMAEAALRSARAEELGAEADLKEAEARYGRRERLVEEGVLSKEELATARVQVGKAGANLEIMRARVAEQVARVEQTKVSLGRTVVRATFGGIVAARYIDPGATVQSGTPIIGLMRSDDLWVRFAVPETKGAALSVGSAVSFEVAGLGVVIRAVVGHLAPGVVPMSPEVIVEAKLEIPAPLSGRIKPGGSGLVSSASGGVGVAQSVNHLP